VADSAPPVSPLLAGPSAVESWLRPPLLGAPDAASDLIVCAAGDGAPVTHLLGSIERIARHLRPALRLRLLASSQYGPALPGGWSRLSLDTAEDWIRVESPVHDAGVLVPRVCFRATVWITLVTVAAHPRFGLRTPFTVHLEAMAMANLDVPWPLLACDVYRLWQPDLSIACLPRAHRTDVGTMLVLADQRGDRLEATLASLAGATAPELPYWREVAARFSVADAPSPGIPEEMTGALPGVNLSRAQAEAVHAVRRQLARRRRTDVRLAIGNLHRIPDFLGRRIAAARGAR